MLGIRKQAQIRSTIGADMRVTGDCAFQGELQVEGTVHGDVRSEGAAGMLVIQPGGRIEGAVSADHIVVAGQVIGQVTARERLELLASGRIEGDVRYKTLEMQPGAVVAGQLQPQALLPAGGEGTLLPAPGPTLQRIEPGALAEDAAEHP